MRWSIFILIVFIQILATIGTLRKTCENLNAEVWGLYFIHNIFDVFLFWPFLFLTLPIEFILHILIALGTAIHWISNNNRCFATVYMNRLCGYPEDMWLDSLKNMLGLRAISEYFSFIWVGLLVAYGLYRIIAVKK
jgi:hypothetical protein